MGFGLLFFASFLTYFGALSPVGTFTYVLGAAMMLLALYKLSTVNKFFFASAIGSFALLLISLVIVVMFVLGYETNAVYKGLVLAQNFLSPILLISVLISIYAIAKEVELRKIQGWCIVDALFVLCYITCDVLSIFIVGDVATSRFGLVGIITQVLFSAFTLVILFNCYAKICYEDDSRMEKKTSGVAAFDALNNAFDKVTNKNKKNKGGK